MSEDKELVEVWREEFEDWINSQFWSECFRGSDKAEYFKVWLAAKRSQPSVVLPDSDDYVYKCGYESSVRDALTAAGIKYTIGE